MKRIFWLVFFLAISLSMQAASWVEGEVYLKDGTVVRFEQKDRIRLPKGRQALKAFRNAFYKTKQKESFAFDQIDSLVCWHPKEKGYPRKYIPVSSTGWCWVYMETPHISVWVYSKKGFSMEADGGIAPLYRSRMVFGHSKVSYYLEKKDSGVVCPLGSAAKYRADRMFRERICRCIEDDPSLCRTILGMEEASRNDLILTLPTIIPQERNNRTIK